MLAEEAAKTLGEQNCLFKGTTDEVTEQQMNDAELVLAGFWTDKGTCADEMKELLEKLEGKKVFLFGTAGFGGNETYFNQILDRVETNLIPEKGNQVLGRFMCQGKMPMSVRTRYEQMQKSNPDDPKFAGMIANFDAALAHPNKADFKGFVTMLTKVIKE